MVCSVRLIDESISITMSSVVTRLLLLLALRGGGDWTGDIILHLHRTITTPHRLNHDQITATVGKADYDYTE